MATKLLGYCLAHGCTKKVESGYCPEHKEHQRTTHLHPLYKTARWRRLRMQKFEAEPLCPDCEAEGRIGLAKELDHDIPHRGNLELFWQENNLVGRCKKHHTAKTRRGK